MLQLCYLLADTIYTFTGEYNITDIQTFYSANNQKIQTLNLMTDLDFKDTEYRKITIPQYFEGHNHTIQNIAYEDTTSRPSLFSQLQQGNEQCHEIFIQNIHLRNVTLIASHIDSDYNSSLMGGLIFSTSNHPMSFINMTIVNSTINLNNNAGCDMIGGLMGLSWGYPITIEQVAIQLNIVQRKGILLDDNETTVFSSYYAGLVGYNYAQTTINNTDVQLSWDSNSTYEHNLVAGLTGIQRNKLLSDTVTIQLQVSAYQATGSQFSGAIADANGQASQLINTNIKMRGNNYRSVHSGVCSRNWKNLEISTLQQDVYMWNNSIDGLDKSINNIVASRDEGDQVAKCENCCATDYGFSTTLQLLQCYQYVSTFLSSNSSISQGQKNCTPEKVNILCDQNALCTLRPYGASTLLTCECFEGYTKNNSICQGTLEEVEQSYSEIDETLMQSGLDPVTISVACIVAALCIVALIWSIWICKNKKKFNNQKKPKVKKQKVVKKQQPKKEESDNGGIQDYDNNLDWKPRQQRNETKNKYYDNNTVLKSKYVSKLKPVQM